MALVLFRPIFLLVAALLVIFMIWLQRRLRLRWWPAWVLRSVFVVAALIGLFFPQGDVIPQKAHLPEILIFDQSDSIAVEARTALMEQAKIWQAGQPNRIIVITGDSPKPVIDPQQTWPIVDSRFSNLNDALQLAGEMFQGVPGTIILASDGLGADTASIHTTMRQLATRGNRMDVLPLATRSDPMDLYLGDILAPSLLWENTALTIAVPVYNVPSSGFDPSSVQVLLNGQEQAITAESFGNGYLRFVLPPQSRGILELSVKVTLENDPFLENNVSYDTLIVYPSPRVLLVSTQPVDPFVGLLTQTGLTVTTITPEEFSSDLSSLANYQVLVVNNVLASRLTTPQMATIRAFADEKGGGVIFLGGQNSYTLGGYKNTILEPMLPVELEPPKRDESPPIAFILVLDKSDSMSIKQEDDTRPIDLAKEAAIRAVEMLDEQDQFGMLAFSTQTLWKIPIRDLGDGITLRNVMDSISSIRADGGTKMYQALKEAVATVEGLPTDQITQRYILLLTDGQSGDGKPEEFAQVAREAQQKGIVISTIALGDKADLDLLKSIAEMGGGRYYFAQNAQDLPRIMMSETRAARSENIQTGETSLQPGELGHPVLSGLSGENLPLLNGYNALTSKVEQGSEDILVSTSFSDPILSSWQFGLGRVVAWMGDLGQVWAGPWKSDAEAGYFWSQVIRYALPNPAIGQAQVSIDSAGTQTIVSAMIQNDALQPLNMLPVSFTYLISQDTARTIPLAQIDPGVYQLELPRLPEGTYRAMVEYAPPEQDRQEVVVPFAVNPPAEWQPASALEVEQGRNNLLTWAAMTGGSEIESLGIDPTAEKAAPTPESNASARWIILLVLVVAWPMEIAARRRWLPWASTGKN